MPSGSFSPTGRTPHDRSRDPQVVAGSTFRSRPATLSVPLHEPICASRWVSNMTRAPWRMNWLGSATAGPTPSHVRSIATLCSVGSARNRSFFSGSMTSMRNGPTEMSERSVSGREARTTCCSSPTRTVTKASVTPRFGYCPRPMIAMNSPPVSKALK